jgi:hypothetical protein
LTESVKVTFSSGIEEDGMALLEPEQTINTGHKAIAARRVTMAVASAVTPFAEHPALPLDDAGRNAFLALIDDESEPNQALRDGAVWFKSLDL